MLFTEQEIKNQIISNQTVNIKYVKVNTEFRYALTGGYVEHKDLVKNNEIAKSAGFFTIGFKQLILHDTASMSLGIGPAIEDKQLLDSIFKPCLE